MLRKIIQTFLNRSHRVLLYGLALILRNIIPINKGQIICTSYSFKRYSCNPKYISEYILDNNIPGFKIIWLLDKNCDTADIDKRIEIVTPNTIRHIIKLYSSEFIINNSRCKKFEFFLKKKKGQKYIQTWHGAIALKKIEGDAISDLSSKYIADARNDSEMCDLFLSDSDWFNNIIRTAFWYNGAILKKGIPRNDIFFDKDKQIQSRQRVERTYNISSSGKILVLYAPTFRNYNAENVFKLDWDSIIASIKKRFCREVTVLIRLHPNSMHYVDIKKLIGNSSIIDVSGYNDMQQLLCACDILITDYSSSMFDFAIMNKPCFIYASDLELYNRGFYFNIKELPFPFAQETKALLENINVFSQDNYRDDISKFMNRMGLNDNGNACKNVFEWMNSNKIPVG